MNLPADYRPYETKKKALVNVHTSEYGPNGWVNKPTEFDVIGEDDHCYIYELRTIEKENRILPIGFHKSRLIKWIPGQLSIKF